MQRMTTLAVTLFFLFMGMGCEAASPKEASPSPEPVSQVQVPPSRAVDPAHLREAEIPYQPQVVASGLQVPWSLAITPDQRFFFTERPGTVRVIAEGELLPEPVITFPPPFISEGEGGLLGIAADPLFAQNHYLYVYHTYQSGGQIFNRVLRLREQNNRAQIDKVLLDRIPGHTIHNGGRIKIGPDGHLYITAGDAGNRHLAQDLSSLAGKILRITTDGKIPADNPFPGSPIYSYGHRNPQGLAWNPRDQKLYSSEHGQSAHDEINVIAPGANYGWPTLQGDELETGKAPPLVHSGENTWAPSGMTFLTRGPWAGRLLVANLAGQQVLSVELTPQANELPRVAAFYHDRYGRIRDVIEGPDGSLYLLTNNRDGRGTVREGDDKIIRLIPRNP